MEIRFKSTACNSKELVKRFNKNFKTSTLSEGEFTSFKSGISGSIKEIHVNNAYILFQDYRNKNSENHVLEVSQNNPVFLLQFVMEGAVSFSQKQKTSNSFSLNKNMYNMFYIPESTYLFNESNTKKQVLNVFFTESFLVSKLGACFVINSKKYQQSKKENSVHSFFDSGLMINAHLRTIVNDFLNCSFDGITKQSYLESKLTELVLIALHTKDSKPKNEKLNKQDEASLLNVEAYIRTHLKEELSIEKLSVLAGFNTSKFKSHFKHVYGVTVFKYITALRIEKAIELIQEEDYTIAQASYEVGYKNPQHFTVAFKKKLGYLPSQLIK